MGFFCVLFYVSCVGFFNFLNGYSVVFFYVRYGFHLDTPWFLEGPETQIHPKMSPRGPPQEAQETPREVPERPKVDPKETQETHREVPERPKSIKHI